MQDIEAAIVYRGWVPESHHRARIAIMNPDGTAKLLLGAMDTPTLPRSSLKPFQVIAMLENGLGLEGEELALAAASHHGEDFHLAAAERILEGAGLSAADLRNTVDFPIDEAARIEWIRGGHDKESIAHNCSGKHSAMMRTCVRAGWELETYRDTSHPLQKAIAATIDEYCGIEGEAVIDGCSAPAFATTLPGLAMGFGRMAAAEDGPAAAIVKAYGDHPEYVAGTGDPTINVHKSIPGSITKLGAEGVLATGLPDGTGIAVKVSDGAARSRFDIMIAILSALGHKVEGVEPTSVIAAELAMALEPIG